MLPEIQHTNAPTNGRKMAGNVVKHSNKLAALCQFIPEIDSVRNTAAMLASFANNKSGNWACFPKIDTLIERVGLSKRTIKYHLKKLAEIGVIAIKRRFKLCPKTGQNRQTSNLYTFNVKKLRKFEHDLQIKWSLGASTRKSKTAPSNCTPRTIPYGNKQNTKKPSSFLNKNQSNHQQWRYDEANRQTDQAWQDMQARKSADPMAHIRAIKRFLKAKPAC